MTAGDLALAGWVRFRGFRPVVQAAIAVAAALALLWGTGYLKGTVSGIRDWWTDRRVAAKQVEIDQLKIENAQLEGALGAQKNELEHVRAALAAKDQQIERLAKEAGEQDARIERGRQNVREVRRGRDPRPIRDRDELDRRLGRIYDDETAPE